MKGKALALLLRHDPARFGVQLDRSGWGDVAAVAAALQLDREALLALVAADSKRRFVLSEDGARIRAAQGHSLDIDLGLTPAEPPDHLWHGTVGEALPAIREVGLLAMGRRHVHLSADAETARRVGRRHGQVVLLQVRAVEMWEAGLVFYLSENGVWLADAVPARFLVIPR